MKLRFFQKLDGSKVLQTNNGVLEDDWVDLHIPIVKEELLDAMIRLAGKKYRDKPSTCYYFLVSPDIVNAAGFSGVEYCYGHKVVISANLPKGTLKFVEEV